MGSETDRNRVIGALQEGLRKDRTRSTIQSFSPLGLLEFTRKRVGKDLGQQLRGKCPTCEGLGSVMSPESVTIDAFRSIASHRNGASQHVHIAAAPSVAVQADYWYEDEREQLSAQIGAPIDVYVDPAVHPEKPRVVFGDAGLPAVPADPRRRRVRGRAAQPAAADRDQRRGGRRRAPGRGGERRQRGRQDDQDPGPRRRRQRHPGRAAHAARGAGCRSAPGPEEAQPRRPPRRAQAHADRGGAGGRTARAGRGGREGPRRPDRPDRHLRQRPGRGRAAQDGRAKGLRRRRHHRAARAARSPSPPCRARSFPLPRRRVRCRRPARRRPTGPR